MSFFMYWPDDYEWSWYLLRPIAAGVFGGGEFNEVWRTASRITLGDRESWHTEWLATANYVKHLAERAEAGNHLVTAREHNLRASNYFRWAEAFLEPDDPRRIPTYDECVACFQHASRWLPHPPEQVELPYEESSLPAYFYPGAGRPDQRVPAILYLAGADVLKEELYFMGGKAVLDRGMALLTMDGPGQGTSLRHRKLYTRYDYEVPVGAALDFLQSRPEVDPERIGVIGRSFGGYLAPRAVAFDQRPKALVVFGAYYEVSERVHSSPHWQWLIGAKSAEEAAERYRDFSLQGVVERIRCPMLIIHGEGDHYSGAEPALRTYEEATCPKELILYKKDEPGTNHCQYDTFTETIPLMMDWLSDHLDHRPSTIQRT